MGKLSALIPASVLKERMEEYQISITQLAGDIKLSKSAVRQLLLSKLKLSLNIAQRLAKYFNTTVDYWVNLQNDYELSCLAKDKKFKELLKAVPKAKLPKAPKLTSKKPKEEKPVSSQERVKKSHDKALEVNTIKAVGRPKGRKPKEKLDLAQVKEKTENDSPVPKVSKSRGRPKGSKNISKTAKTVEDEPEIPKKPHSILIKNNKKRVEINDEKSTVDVVQESDKPQSFEDESSQNFESSSFEFNFGDESE